MSNTFSSLYNGLDFDDTAQATAKATVEQDNDSLQFPQTLGQGRPFSGVERNARQGRAARTTPYHGRRSDNSRAPSSSTAPFSDSVPIHQLPWKELPHERQTSINYNNHIYGGTGGPGGWGIQGHGGDGGFGEGPTVHYHIGAADNINHIRNGESGLHILYRASACDATHDSQDRFPQPKCHPETRTKLLDVLSNWAKGIDPPVRWNSQRPVYSDKPASPILWLYGPAGAGKSAVAQSLCLNLEEEGHLGASFFFKRGHPSRGHAKQLFVTIAYQLACRLPELNPYITQKVQNDPSLVDKTLSIQLQKLIVEPCQQMGFSSPRVVIIDGLDECDGQNTQQEILRSIGQAVHELQLPLRFLVASRPEPQIHEIFSRTLNRIYRDINVEQSFDDVRKYLLDEFARIYRDHDETMATVPSPWPTPETVDSLVKKSSGYFIYASTVIRFIDDKNFRPTQRLQMITSITEPQPNPGSPFATLDALYLQILSVVPCRSLVLEILAVGAADFFNFSLEEIDQLLELEAGGVRLALRGLRSVIGTVWSGFKCSATYYDDWAPNSKIVVHHASFLDFLKDPVRAGIFYIGSESVRTDLCRHILRALGYSAHGFFYQ
ncbi:putative nwd2 protein [Mycena venus]|uniref:Putative nwd2 protein n=1 Tax=Mycena venus TaxID=2733690 RepID=A0A8H6XQ01_9AGAR|nr:putative nwd2 protein [Mycena venus]